MRRGAEINPRPSGRRTMPRPRMDWRQLRVRHDRRPEPLLALPNDWADGVLGGMIADALGAGEGMLCRRP